MSKVQSFIQKHHELSKPWERVFWWIIRGMMFYAIGISIYRFIKTGDSAYFTQALQSTANTVGMFAWEIMLCTSKKCFFHYIPAYVQNITLFGFFLGSFGGAFLNFYYSIPPYDIILHVFGGAEATFIGYEIITAIQKRDRKPAPVVLVILCACGISFMFGTGWEIFEFTFDQIAGGDSQHWSMALAKDACEKYGCSMPNIIPALDDMRYALIDTMEDTIANVIGAAAMSAILFARPYHHKGEKDVNKKIEENYEFA